MRRILSHLFLLTSAYHGSIELRAQPPAFSKLVVNGQAAPEARIDGVVAYDIPGKQIFLFGGDGTNTLNDLWSYSLSTGQWKSMEVQGQPPAPRLGHTMVFDSKRRRLVVFGGQSAGFFNDTWAFDIAASRWNQLDAGSNPVKPEAALAPPKRYGHSAVYDSRRDRMIVSHGFTDAGRFDDTWAYDFTAGGWIDLNPRNRPLRRCLHHAVYDPPNDQMLLYGGCASGTPFPNNCPLGDLWAFNLASHTWTEITGNPRPQGRQWYGTGFDTLRNRMVVFGGSGPGDLNDTWEYDPAVRRWEQARPPGDVPSPRNRHQATFVDDLGGVVFFGGRARGSKASELWLYGRPYTAPAVAAGPNPVISDNGVTGVFSGRSDPLSPGKIVTIFGDFGPERPVTTSFAADTLRLPTEAGELYVLFNGIRAPLLHVQGSQVNTQAPYELAGVSEATVQVAYQGRLSAVQRVAVRPTSPDVFPNALHADGTLVTTDRPAEDNEVLIFFATGHGITVPASVTGAAARDMLAEPASPVRLLIGGREAEILFRGQAPGTAGLIQVNARMPAGLSGMATAALEIGGVRSQEFRFAVR